ncbi:hypothetical protein, partial [Salmonella enterica]|uniref:hypothetical protein n=1 Tax=Salmonella enterica TaxID=28901 RepID=UPI0039E9A012
FLCVKEAEFWNFSNFQHGIGANPGYLKVKYAEGTEFVFCSSLSSSVKVQSKEFESISLYSLCEIVAEQLVN